MSGTLPCSSKGSLAGSSAARWLKRSDVAVPPTQARHGRGVPGAYEQERAGRVPRSQEAQLCIRALHGAAARGYGGPDSHQIEHNELVAIRWRLSSMASPHSPLALPGRSIQQRRHACIRLCITHTTLAGTRAADAAACYASNASRPLTHVGRLLLPIHPLMFACPAAAHHHP